MAKPQARIVFTEEEYLEFTRYRQWNETLTDYLLVSLNQAFVEHFLRREDGEWIYRSYPGLGQEVPIDSIQCVLLTTDSYDRINFPAISDDETDDEVEEGAE